VNEQRFFSCTEWESARTRTSDETSHRKNHANGSAIFVPLNPSYLSTKLKLVFSKNFMK